MTETEWLVCTDPQKMLAFLRAKTSDRKLRLFALACIRPFRSLLMPEAIDALAIAEKFADGSATSDDRKLARRQVFHVGRRADISNTDIRGLAMVCVRALLARRSYIAAIRVADCTRQMSILSTGGFQGDALEKTQCGWKTADWTSPVREQVLLQVNILHDLFDDLFRKVPFDPKWRTREVLDRARSVYEEHAFDRIPALADSLTAAGCDNGEFLAHCHNGKPHYRGCWAVDLILGRS
jgi:hypothetical protein